jgi:hypothetical protein
MLLSDLEADTVDYIPNFDASEVSILLHLKYAYLFFSFMELSLTAPPSFSIGFNFAE